MMSEAIAALISDLYSTIVQLRARISELEATKDGE